MIPYIVKRLVLAIPTFFISTLVVFVIIQFSPVSPVDNLMETAFTDFNGQPDSKAVSELIEVYNKHYGLDKPVFIRYLIWLGFYPRSISVYEIDRETPEKLDNGTLAWIKKQKHDYQIIDFSQNKVLDICKPENSSDYYSGKDHKSIMVYEGHSYLINEFRNYGSMDPYLITMEKHAYLGIFQGYFGDSYYYYRPVSELVYERLPVSMQFGISSLIICLIAGILFGLGKGMYNGNAIDKLSDYIILLFYAVPGWIIGSLLLALLGTGTFIDVIPLGGLMSSPDIYQKMSTIEKIFDRMWHFILPLLSYTLGSLATIVLIIKSNTVCIKEQNYIIGAYARGINSKRIIFLHILKNAILPIAARIGGFIGIFLAGSYIIEKIFNIDGIGKLSFEAVVRRDYPLIYTFAFFAIIIQITGNLISDIILAYLNPRIRFVK